jgi:hypothetical protein
LEETYGQVPDNVVLLSLDTDDLRDVDAFAGTHLETQTDDRGRDPEFCHIVSRPGVTMDTIFADIASGRSTSYMHWLEKEKLSRILSPTEKDIRGGAQQRRPVGRIALFQRWDNPIYSSIRSAITQMYGVPEEESPVDAVELEQSKRQIFIVSSVAGGTGSGFLIDVANLVGHAIRSNPKWQSVDISAIILLPDAFSSYTTMMNDPTNLKPNSYAALRELDRFIRTHGEMLPYMIRYGDDLRSITWSTNQPVDHVYLVDTGSPSAVGDIDLSGDPARGVFPIISDFVMAHIDQSLGDSLASMRANAGLHYDKEEGWQYSSFNVMSYILPIDDIIESFSYRFLQELLRRQYLPIPDKKFQAQVELVASKEVDRVFSESNVGGHVNPGIIQKSIAATKRVDPETPDTSWPGLFNMISLSEGAFAEDYQTLQRWMDYLSANLMPTKEGDYKHETYDEGYTRLVNFCNQFMDECLGPQYDPDDEEAREGGQWDIILARYRDALRQRFVEALDAELLAILNRRDPHSKMLAAAQLPTAQAAVAQLKDHLVSFKALLTSEYGQSAIETRLRQVGEELRNSIAWMQDTKDTKTRSLFGPPEARKAQDSYVGWFYEKMELLLHRKMYRIVMDVLDALGAAEVDRSGTLSVVDQAAQELESWQGTLLDTHKILQDWSRAHESHRREKRQIKVRRYLTDPEFEAQLYQQPEHVEAVAQQVLGEVRGARGLSWERLEETEPLNYKMVSMWAEEAKGSEDIARKFFGGTKGLFQVIRENVSVADRVTDSFQSHSSFTNMVGQINEPFLRYNPSANGKTMFHERYVSFNLAKATSDEAREFLDKAHGILRDQGRTVDLSAESAVSCTVVEVARGVRLPAVEQFVACENDYRGKLYRGRESLHLFPEEQVATEYEELIESLDESDNHLRLLSPELVITMRNEALLRTFTLFCAYGLIHEAPFQHPETGVETTEVILDLGCINGPYFPLSRSELVRSLDRRFDRVSSEAQLGYLYLNALQNFVLKVVGKPGMPTMSAGVVAEQLRAHGVSFGHIQTPFSLSLRTLNEAMGHQLMSLKEGDRRQVSQTEETRLATERRVMEYLRPFLLNRVSEFKDSPVPKIKDMGTVMHLILNQEIARLLEIEGERGAYAVLFEYDSIASTFARRGHQQKHNTSK